MLPTGQLDQDSDLDTADAVGQMGDDFFGIGDEGGELDDDFIAANTFGTSMLVVPKKKNAPSAREAR